MVDLDAIARALAGRTYPGYPGPQERLFLATPGVRLCDNVLYVPDGPWQVNAHPNRQGVDAALLDAPRPTAAQKAHWQRQATHTDQHGRPLHPHWQALLGDPRIGLPTGPGAFYRYGPNVMVDAAIYRWHNNTLEWLLIRQRATGRWGLPGGFAEPDDASLLAAACREVQEEAGIAITTAPAECLQRGLPMRQRDTLNAWAEVAVFLVHAPASYLRDVPLHPGDDADRAMWCSVAATTQYALLDTHTVYLMQAQQRVVQLQQGR